MSSSTMSDPYRNFSIFHHRPHKTLKHMLNALAATAVYRIWFTLLFMGGWSSMVVLVNQKTAAKLEFPNTMITVLGVVLGLTLSYRWEGLGPLTPGHPLRMRSTLKDARCGR